MSESVPHRTTARTVAAFVSLPAVAWLAMALDRRWSAARVMIVPVAAGLVMLLVGVWRTWSDFDQGNLAVLRVRGRPGGDPWLPHRDVGVVGTLGCSPDRERHAFRPASTSSDVA